MDILSEKDVNFLWKQEMKNADVALIYIFLFLKSKSRVCCDLSECAKAWTDRVLT